ncbi:MAG: DUF192 domain-containing protein [Actinomycetota bacterium]
MRAWVVGAVAMVAAAAVGGAVWLTEREDVSFSSVAVAVSPGDHEGCLLLADSGPERRRGLMERADLGGHDGMLFSFEEEQQLSFWMRNTPMPLSIAFFDRDGGFVSSADMEPCGDRDDCPSTHSGAPAMYAVEVRQGELGSLGLVEGSRLRTGGTCTP